MLDPDLTVLVTGSTDGLGRQVAGELARCGARVIVHGRSPEKVEPVASEIGAADALVAELASMDQVRDLADQVEHLDVLINNAGVISSERQESLDGLELTFAVNHLAHFALTGLLLPKLTAKGRIVNIASIAQAPIDFADIGFERGYDAYTAYARSKLAQVMFTVELAQRLGGPYPSVNAVHPATLMDTKLAREGFGQARTSVREGTDVALRLAVAPEHEGVTGRFFNGTRESRARPQASDPDARRMLWSVSEQLTDVLIPV